MFWAEVEYTFCISSVCNHRHRRMALHCCSNICLSCFGQRHRSKWKLYFNLWEEVVVFTRVHWEKCRNGVRKAFLFWQFGKPPPDSVFFLFTCFYLHIFVSSFLSLILSFFFSSFSSLSHPFLCLAPFPCHASSILPASLSFSYTEPRDISYLFYLFNIMIYYLVFIKWLNGLCTIFSPLQKQSFWIKFPWTQVLLDWLLFY